MSIKTVFSNKQRNSLVKMISSGRNNTFFKFFADFAHYYLLAYKNVSYNSMTNGENDLFKVLTKHQAKTIIDCGANVGTNAEVYKIFNKEAKIYCIEAIPQTYDILTQKVSNLSDVHCFNIGMGSENKTVTFNHFPNNHYLSSQYEISEVNNLESVQVDVNIIKGDDFCSEHNIQEVDFLKIDVEGMDFEVILGFEQMIKDKKIKTIQFEYTHAFIHSRHFLKDVYDFFADKGYLIGDVYPNGVDFKPYKTQMEDFSGANYLIIRDDLTDLIKDLKKF